MTNKETFEDIQPIIYIPPPFDLDDKIFYYSNENGDSIGEPYSYNEWLKIIESISGVNPDLLGPYES